ncbi:hypothetical protein RHSIM_RhsimUnG0231900 [Rhododendron simsii]|uniref:threonine ammonia-lyase n=1 Tax=Rhododendron simsii TaxID=118357 RepID=A0A834FTF9_RHOSS|nr:hypothetical protein RHSIM_RhsimUnG0231900 [Rhododendron simsii]
MAAITFASPPSLLRPKFSNPSAKIKPYVCATLSKPTAEISIKPAVATREKQLQILPRAPQLRVSPDSLQYPAGFLGAVPDRAGGGCEGDGVLNAMEYLTNILASRVYDVAIESPLQLASKLSERLGVKMWLKREDLQPVFSFKLRGAYNMMAKLPREQLERGVICSSAGNHAQGVALAAKRLGCSAVIVMPVTTPEIKWKSVERLGATVVLVGDAYDDAQKYAKNRGQEEGRTFVPPFDHPDIIMGQGTVGMEIVRQIKGPIHAIFVPVGGGGLIAGIAAYIKRVSPEVKVIGVEPSDANAMALSLHHGQRVMLDQVGGFADGVAVKEVGVETFRLCTELIDGVVLVSRDAICASIKAKLYSTVQNSSGMSSEKMVESLPQVLNSITTRNLGEVSLTGLIVKGRLFDWTNGEGIDNCRYMDMFEEKRNILEPAGALALAGAEAYCKYYGLQDENVVVITSGANMNFDRLRLVTELADVGRQREAVLATYLPEEPGSFKQFCELVGPMNITEFKYRYNADKNPAQVLYSVGLHTVSELGAMVDRLESSQLRTINLTSNDLVKDHLRHLIGGRSYVQNEVLCRFVFPERPGALVKFLDAFSPQWNITLFHYRGQGETGANVLVGIQVAQTEMDEFRFHANNLGYDYVIETDNEAFRLLVQ